MTGRLRRSGYEEHSCAGPPNSVPRNRGSSDLAAEGCVSQTSAASINKSQDLTLTSETAGKSMLERDNRRKKFSALLQLSVVVIAIMILAPGTAAAQDSTAVPQRAPGTSGMV